MVISGLWVERTTKSTRIVANQGGGGMCPNTGRNKRCALTTFRVAALCRAPDVISTRRKYACALGLHLLMQDTSGEEVLCNLAVYCP